MLARLLESKADRNRSGWGALVSTVAHTVAIGGAVFATAQARVDKPKDVVSVVRWMNPPAPRPPSPAAPAPSVERAPVPALPDLVRIEQIDIATPRIDLTLAFPPFNPAPHIPATRTSDLRPDIDRRFGNTQPLLADQVEREAYLRPGSSPPHYPNALRSAGVEGQVVALFVVNESGGVELASVRFARSDHALFESAVRNALAAMQFAAAEVGGRKVRQLVQMPFVFRLSR